MISEFLRAEYFSPRFSEPIRDYLNTTGLSAEIILNPDLAADSENNNRAKILNSARGYLERKPGNVFNGFPSDVTWNRVEISTNDLGEIFLPNHPTWLQITQNTRLLRVGAQHLMVSDPTGNPARFVRDFMSNYTSDDSYPLIMAVGRDLYSRLVILEGSVRSISYWLMREKIKFVEILIGTSPQMNQYDAC